MNLQLVWPSVHHLLESLRDNVFADPLSACAIVLGVVGIWRAESLFRRLETTLEHLIVTMKNQVLDSMITVTGSYASFRRAMQVVEIPPDELPEDAAFALLTSFHFQSVRFANAKPEDLSKLRKDTRAKVDTDAKGYVQMLLSSRMARKRPGVRLVDDPPAASEQS